jgi:hypothetical protein
MSVGDRERDVAAAARTELFINCRRRPASSSQTFDIANPSTGTVLRAVPPPG